MGTGSGAGASAGVSTGTYTDGDVEENVGACGGFVCGSGSRSVKGNGASGYAGVGVGGGADYSVSRTWVMND